MRVFHKRISSSSSLEYDTAGHLIVFRVQMYSPKVGGLEAREVVIDNEDWLAIVKYGEDAGFQQ